MAIADRVKATFQKNVLVYIEIVNTETQKIVGRKDVAMTYKDFFQWLDLQKIEHLTFRPSNPDYTDLVNRRIKHIEKLGFAVQDSNDLHFFKFGSRTL